MQKVYATQKDTALDKVADRADTTADLSTRPHVTKEATNFEEIIATVMMMIMQIVLTMVKKMRLLFDMKSGK